MDRAEHAAVRAVEARRASPSPSLSWSPRSSSSCSSSAAAAVETRPTRPRRRRRRRRPPTAQATKEPKPVSSLPPLVGMGDTVRFQTPDGAVVRVTVDDYADPGDAPSGATADPGERLVTLELSVTPEGAEGTASVPLPFEKADSFILIAEDDTLTVAQLGDDELLGATAAARRDHLDDPGLLRRRGRADPLRVHAGRGVAAAVGHLGPEQVTAAAGPARGPAARQRKTASR